MELILVVAVLVILAGLSYPVIDSLFANSRLTEASDQIRARWSEARSRAIQERRSYRFAIKENTGKFRIAPDTGEYWEDGEPSANTSNQQALVMEGALPQRVLFGSPDALTTVSDWRTLVTFLPDGTANEDVEVNLSTKGTRSVTLRLRAVTGTATTAALTSTNKDS